MSVPPRSVIVADAVRFEGDEVAVFPLTRAQADHVRANLAENALGARAADHLDVRLNVEADVMASYE